jgi:hypothetical protein
MQLARSTLKVCVDVDAELGIDLDTPLSEMMNLNPAGREQKPELRKLAAATTDCRQSWQEMLRVGGRTAPSPSAPSWPSRFVTFLSPQARKQ